MGGLATESFFVFRAARCLESTDVFSEARWRKLKFPRDVPGILFVASQELVKTPNADVSVKQFHLLIRKLGGGNLKTH
jgi:hypothetical protein